MQPMSNSPTWNDQEDPTQPPGYFQVRKPIRSSTPPPATELNVGLFFDRRNRTYLALSVSGLIALIAFFMPYFTVSAVVSGTPTFLNIPLVESSPLPTAGSDAANGFALLWIVLLAAVIVITVAAVLILDTGTLRALTPIIGAIVLLVSGLAGFVVLIVSLFRANSDISFANQLLAGAHTVTKYHVVLGIGLGFWLSLVAMLCVAILGGLSLRRAW